jgi:predicted ferric reductase
VRSKWHVRPLEAISLTALVSAPAAASWAAPVRLDKDAAVDRTVRLAAVFTLWLGLLLVTYWWIADGGVNDLASWVSGLTSVGRLTGLWAADLLLIQVLLMSRLPPLEHAFGRDRLARIHRVVGLLSFYLMVSHIVLIIAGYASGQWSAVLPTTWELISAYGGILLAAAGTACLIMVVLTSLKASRRRLRYESWHLLHLYGYLGVGLALPHQLWTGQEFLSSPAATVYWWTLWAAAAAAVAVWRILLPLWRSARYRLRVAGVVRESSDVVSVYLTGSRLDQLPLRAGQFINVRFLTRPGWTRANPFSLSIAPNGHILRITAKVLGEGSARLAYLRPGTRVLFEGPYGRLSSRARAQRKVVLAGAGVGITPLRALAEGLDYAPGEAIILQRYTAEPLFTRELEMLAAEKGLEVVHLPGPRRTRNAVLGPAARGLPELIALRRWIPDLAERDVFLCGPSAWTNGVEGLALAAGVPSERIHIESFGW